MEIPGGKNQHFRHLLYFAFRRGQKAASCGISSRHLRSVWRGCNNCEDCSKLVCQIQKWLFRPGRPSCSGRPSEFDEDRFKAILKEDGRQTGRELAEKVNCGQKTILNHIHSMGFAEKLGAF